MKRITLEYGVGGKRRCSRGIKKQRTWVHISLAWCSERKNTTMARGHLEERTGWVTLPGSRSPPLLWISAALPRAQILNPENNSKGNVPAPVSLRVHFHYRQKPTAGHDKLQTLKHHKHRKRKRGSNLPGPRCLYHHHAARRRAASLDLNETTVCGARLDIH